MLLENINCIVLFEISHEPNTKLVNGGDCWMFQVVHHVRIQIMCETKTMSVQFSD